MRSRIYACGGLEAETNMWTLSNYVEALYPIIFPLFISGNIYLHRITYHEHKSGYISIKLSHDG